MKITQKDIGREVGTLGGWTGEIFSTHLAYIKVEHDTNAAMYEPGRVTRWVHNVDGTWAGDNAQFRGYDIVCFVTPETHPQWFI